MYEYLFIYLSSILISLHNINFPRECSNSGVKHKLILPSSKSTLRSSKTERYSKLNRIKENPNILEDID